MKRFIFIGLVVLGAPSVVWGQARGPARGQAPPPTTTNHAPTATTDQMVEVDPIRCWWRTSTGAIRIGETFDLSLTCAVLENDLVQVVPDESRLPPAPNYIAPV